MVPIPESRPAMRTAPIPAPDPPELTVLMLTREEAENLKTLLPELIAALDPCGITYEILVVDADSKDGSAEIAASHGARVLRQGQPGYGNALREGIAMARGTLLLTLDADLSHRPQFLERMLGLRHAADIVIASRYVAGGGADMPLTRRVLSKILNGTFSSLLGIPVRDMSSGFRLYRLDVIRDLGMAGEHFDILPEIVSMASLRGARIREIPFQYSARGAGVSKARALAFAPSYWRTLRRCRRERKVLHRTSEAVGREYGE